MAAYYTTEEPNLEYIDSDGKRHVTVGIYCDSKTGNIPTTGDEVDGLTDNDIIEKTSTCYVMSDGSLWMLNAAGTWVEQ